MQAARVRIDREIELPAGVIRVAPLEETVNGHIVIPIARFGEKTARNLRLEIKSGVIVRIAADENLAAVETALNTGGEVARRFREFALGFNPKLQMLPQEFVASLLRLRRRCRALEFGRQSGFGRSGARRFRALVLLSRCDGGGRGQDVSAEGQIKLGSSRR